MRRSSASNSGCSIAAKWPPRGILVHRCAPIEGVPPVSDEPSEIFKVGAGLPSTVSVVGPSRVFEALPQIAQDFGRDLNLEWANGIGLHDASLCRQERTGATFSVPPVGSILASGKKFGGGLRGEGSRVT